MPNPAADFPTAIHSASDVSGFSSSELGATSPVHTGLEGKQESELVAVETKLGLDSSTPNTDYTLMGVSAGHSAWFSPSDARINLGLEIGVDVLGELSQDASPQLGGDLDLNEHNIQIKATPATDLHASGIIISLTANENQAFGDLVYLTSTPKAAIADADAIATAVVVAMAIATITANNAGLYLLMGVARNDAWNWTIGGKIYLSTTGTTGNTLTQTAPSGTDDCIVEVGVALSADSIFFNPTIQAIVEHI